MQMNNSIHLPVRFYESCKDTVLINWREYTGHLNLLDVIHHKDILNGAKLSYLHFIYLCMQLQ